MKEDFRLHKNESDPKKIREFYDYGMQQLQLVRRQALINQMYAQKMVFMDPRVPDDVRIKEEKSFGRGGDHQQE